MFFEIFLLEVESAFSSKKLWQLSQQSTPNSLGRAVGAAWRRTVPMVRRTAPICRRTAPMRSADADESADGTGDDIDSVLDQKREDRHPALIRPSEPDKNTEGSGFASRYQYENDGSAAAR